MSKLAELLERFRRGAELVAVASLGASGAQLDYVPAPGAWSVRQIMCHLGDAEMVGGVRFRRVVAEENPVLETYDQNAWATNLHYENRRISRALELFRKLRGENYELLSQLPEQAFARTGNHTELGVVTLGDLLRLYAEHAEKHVRQIQAVRQQYKQSQIGA